MKQNSIKDIYDFYDLLVTQLQPKDEDCICLHGIIGKDGKIDLSEESEELLKSLKKEPSIPENNEKQDEDCVTLYSIEELFEQGYNISRKGVIYSPESDEIFVKPEYFYLLGKTISREEFENIGVLSTRLIKVKEDCKCIDKSIQKVNVPVEIELSADDNKIFMLTQKERINFTEDDLKFVREYTINFKETAQNKNKKIKDIKEKIKLEDDLNNIIKWYADIVSTLVRIKEILTALDIIHNIIMQSEVDALCGKE